MSTSSNLDLNLASAGSAEGLPAPAWKHELNERLQATRARRSRKLEEQSSLATLEQLGKSESRASRLAAKVAERYANVPSYREILAAETRAAAIAAEAAATAAQHAAIAAQRAAIAAQIFPQEMEAEAAEEERPGYSRSSAESEGAGSADSSMTELSGSRSQRETGGATYEAHGWADQAGDALILPVQPLPVNLIEFPRELVATRKARPRLAEGPLREGADDPSRLRIFEAQPPEIPMAGEISAASLEWSSIRLDSKSLLARQEQSFSLELPLKTAPLEDRLMAGIFDLAVVLFSFVLFVLVFIACTAHPPTGKPAWIAGAFVLGGLFLLYQYLFFRFTEGTPGMRYAKIALCTFEDENPTRKEMRRRIPFLLLSAAPLGLGFAWAWFDTDRLGWHDRLTRMYQRSYRS